MSTLGVHHSQGGSTRVDDTQLIPAPGSPRVRVACGAQSHPGKVRANNEDHYLVAKLAKSMQIKLTSLEQGGETRFSDEDGYLLVVADGMGGAAAGERASALAVETIKEFALNTLKWFLHQTKIEENALLAELRKSLEVADRSVYDEAEADHRLAGMGTTLTMAFCVGSDLYIVHAGDSRAYLYRDGTLEQVTQDHTLVQMLVDGGVITPEAAKHHNRRNIVTNVIGGPAPGVQAEIHKVRLVDGDVLLLCSDGLSEPVDDASIAEVLGEVADPDQAAQRLVDVALERGAPDNVTVLVARYNLVD